MRVSVKGDILSLENPSSAWLTNFRELHKFPVSSYLSISLPIAFLTYLLFRRRRSWSPLPSAATFSVLSVASPPGRCVRFYPRIDARLTPLHQVVVFGISSIESSFAYHVARGPQGWAHPDQPALTVARSVLNAMEGFLWKCESLRARFDSSSGADVAAHSHSWCGTGVWRQHRAGPRDWFDLLPRTSS